jgi:hypothetical protein
LQGAARSILLPVQVGFSTTATGIGIGETLAESARGSHALLCGMAETNVGFPLLRLSPLAAARETTAIRGSVTSATRTIAAKAEERSGLPFRRVGIPSLGRREEIATASAPGIGTGKERGSPCASESASGTHPLAACRLLDTLALPARKAPSIRLRHRAEYFLLELARALELRRPIRRASSRQCPQAVRARPDRTEVETTRTTVSTLMQGSPLHGAESESRHELCKTDEAANQNDKRQTSG